MNIYNTIQKIEKMLSKYDSYKITIYDKNKTYASNKDKEEEIQSSTYAVGFQIPPVNDEYEDYYNKKK
jgi:hypothetical protein